MLGVENPCFQETEADQGDAETTWQEVELTRSSGPTSPSHLTDQHSFRTVPLGSPPHELESSVVTISGNIPETNFLPQSVSTSIKSLPDSKNSPGSKPVKRLSRIWKLKFIKSESARRRALLLLCSLLFGAILIIGGCGIVLYLTVGQGMDAFGNNGLPIDEEDPAPGVVVGRFRILNTTGEADWTKQQIRDQLDLLFRSSQVAGEYVKTEVLGVEKQVTLHVHLSRYNPRGAESVGWAFLHGLRKHHNHVWLGRFAVDIHSVKFTETLRGDSPPIFKSPMPVPPAWGEWGDWGPVCPSPCTGAPTQSRVRTCKGNAGEGYILDSIEACLLHQKGGDMEIRDCPPCDVLATGTPFQSSTPMSDLHPYNESYKRINERACVECPGEEVCIALTEGTLPRCLPPRDPSDPTGCGGLCQMDKQVCQRLSSTTFSCKSYAMCDVDQWKCKNGLCIHSLKRCDGKFDCYDQSDESNCVCGPGSFHCGNETSCLPTAKRCDGKINCWDGSDELNCTKQCPNSLYTCTSGQCVPRRHFCDGVPDCDDGSDELSGCGGDCQTHEWRCRNGRCIDNRTRCDGFNTCGDKDRSDEEQCDRITITPYHKRNECRKPTPFACANGECIEETSVCNGVDNCGDNSDEYECDRMKRHGVPIR